LYEGEYDLAIADCNKAIELAPNFSDAYNNRGGAYLNLDQYERAIEDFSEAIRLNPQDGLAYANRAKAYTLLDMDTEAEQDASRAIELGVPPDVLQRQIEELKKQL